MGDRKLNLSKLEQWFFYILVFFLPLQQRSILYLFRSQFNEWTSAYLYGTDILIFLILFLWLTRKAREKGFKIVSFQNIWFEIGLFLFLLVSEVSLFLSANFWLSFYNWLKLVEFGLLFLYVKYNFGRMFSLERFWQIFAASAVTQSAIAAFQFFAQRSLGLKFLAESPLSPDIAGVAKILVNGQKFIRAYGLVPHPNILAAILMLATFGLALLFIKKYNQLNISYKILFTAIFALLSLALFLTFSRAATLMGLVALMGWLACLYRMQNYRKPVLMVFMVLFAISFLLLVIFWPFAVVRYDTAALGKNQAVSLRVFYNQMAWWLIKGSPYLGIGQGNFVWTFSSPAVFENWVFQPVHNIYLLIAAETGLLGLFAFLWFLFKIMRSVYLRWRQGLEDKLAFYCFLSIAFFLLSIGFFDHFLWDLQQGQLIFWMSLGALASFSAGSQTVGIEKKE